MANTYNLTVKSVVERIRETAEDTGEEFITTASDSGYQMILKTPKRPDVVVGQDMTVTLKQSQKKL